MKKIIISITTISVFIFTSCFTDTDTATVKINLGNIPVAKTAKVEKKSIIDRFVALFLKEAVAQPVVPYNIYVTTIHLGAFDANNQLLIDKKIEVTQEEEEGDIINTVVEFDVPAGVRRKIVVLGTYYIEGEDNDLNYYGVSDEITLIAGENREVPIEMMNMYEGFQDYLNIEDDKNTRIATWNPITGASKYRIYEYSSHIQDVIKTEFYANPEEGLNNEYYYLHIYFGFADIESTSFTLDFCN